ncbi:MAG: CapA family protein, partial [Firmicutes bacterium]|nr:CapA family protein [Bacillota bacterium]
QQEEMAAIYPGSLNTLKLGTLRTDKKVLGFETGRVHFIYAGLGMGRSGSWTDDLQAGGLTATVGVNGGKVMTDGISFEGESFEDHPDTNKIIKGFEVPFYKEAKDLVMEMARTRLGFYEWSIAITETGPKLMGVDVFPMADRVQLPYAPQAKGMRKNMDKYYDVSLRPEMPYGTRVTKISKEGIEFYWKKPEHAKGYVVYRSYDPENGFQEIARINSRAVGEYTDADYDRDREKIYYQVRSFIKDDEGGFIYSPVTDPKEAAKKIDLEISHENLYLYSGSSRKLQVYFEWSEPKEVEWSADAPEVASVDSEGVVTAHKTGVSNITCFSHESGTSVTCQVTVNRQAPEPLGEITSRYEYSEGEGCYVQAEPKQEGTAVIMMVGDMMCGKTQSDAQWDPEVGWNYNDSYEYVRRVTKDSDLAVGNLETLLAAGWPYMSDEAYIDNKNNCNSPSRYLDAVKYGGIDAVVMSNNHNCDGGTRALTETIEQVDRYNFIRTGVYKDASEKRFFIAKVNGIKVGFLSYNSSKTGFNFKDADWTKEEKNTMLNVFTEEKIKKDVKDLREAGAEYIIVYMHWGIKNFKN